MHRADEQSTWQEKEQRRHRPSSHGTHHPSALNHHRTPAAESEIGHWVRTAGILAPLLIGEFVKDPERKWRFIRIASVSAAVLSEGLHAHKNYKARERDRQALEACETASASI